MVSRPVVVDYRATPYLTITGLILLLALQGCMLGADGVFLKSRECLEILRLSQYTIAGVFI